MRLKSKTTALLASLALAGGVITASVAAAPAQAAYTPPGINGATPVSTQLAQMAHDTASPAAITTAAYNATGICVSSVCWRNNNNALDAWARDISGDPNQQFQVTYWGQADQGADGNACSQYGNVGVYTFVSPADGYKFEGAAFFSGGVYYAGGGSGNTRYTNWIWNSNGTLENCGDSQNGARFALQYASLYSQMYTANTGFGTTWTQVHV